MQICVVGGGAGGVEISLALNHCLKTERQKAGKHEEAKCSVILFSKGQILQGHTPAARHKLLRLAQVCCTTLHLAALVCAQAHFLFRMTFTHSLLHTLSNALASSSTAVLQHHG